MQIFLEQILVSHPVLAPIIYILVRALSIVIPPFLGIFVDLAGIAIFDWKIGFILAQIGVMLGAMIAFAIGRFFREPILKRFISLQKIDDWQKKLSESETFWGLVVLRLFTNPFFDYISYIAGLTRISGEKFFLTTLIGSIPQLLLFFYFGGKSYDQGIYYTIAFIIAVTLIGNYWRKKSKKLH